ncbi:MAG: hypothetical protein JXR22_11555, partial [Prolixibacteraceae bacterium]|nr:hypothetical protein [Prolixibacteraceae bacterium]
MKKKLMIRLLLLLFAFGPGNPVLFAQQFGYCLKYEGIGDNREYFSPYHQAETILGSRLSMTAGFTSDSVHRVHAGFSNFYEYGSRLLEQAVLPILYYDFATPGFRLTMGAFPRTESFAIPSAFISERYTYFEPNIDGLAMQYQKGDGKLGLMLDWVSRQDSSRREQFWTGLHGQQKLGVFSFDAFAFLFHNAHRMNRLPDDFIEDNMGSLVLAGIDLSEKTFLDVLTLQSGVLSSFFRNRGDGSEFEVKHSSYTVANAAYRWLGAEIIMKIGNQHHLAFGDDFYNNVENYSRLRLYSQFFDTRRVKGTFAWTFHLANGDLDQQQ